MTRWIPALVLALAGALGDAAELEGRPLAELRPVVADEQQVAEVLDEAEVDRTPAEPGVADWVAAMARRVGSWFDEQAAGHGTLLTAIFTGAGWLMVVLVVLLAVAGIVVCGVAYRQRRLKLVEPADAWSHSHDTSSDPVVPSADQSWMEFERLLGEGRIRDAAEPLWRWLVAIVAGDQGEASWTSGDLVRFTGRFEDLGPALARLDAVVYGALETESAQLRRLSEDLRELV